MTTRETVRDGRGTGREELLAAAADEAIRRARRTADHAYGPGRGMAAVYVADVQRTAESAGLRVTATEAADALRARLELRRPLDLCTDAYLNVPARTTQKRRRR